MKLDLESMPPEYREALEAYAAAKGKKWMQELTYDWASGKDERFPKYGPTLRSIRNHHIHGPAITKAAWG
jgi:hypothetical protein